MIMLRGLLRYHVATRSKYLKHENVGDHNDDGSGDNDDDDDDGLRRLKDVRPLWMITMQ